MNASKPEPPPTRSPESQPVVTPCYLQLLRSQDRPGVSYLADLIEQRRHFGIQKYGEELHTHNGRDAIEDARQELGDLIVYLRQAYLEGREEEVFEMTALIRRLFL